MKAIDEARKQKHQLEHEIAARLGLFSKETGLRVHDIRLENVDTTTMGDRYTQHYYAVYVEVRI